MFIFYILLMFSMIVCYTRIYLVVFFIFDKNISIPTSVDNFPVYYPGLNLLLPIENSLDIFGGGSPMIFITQNIFHTYCRNQHVIHHNLYPIKCRNFFLQFDWMVNLDKDFWLVQWSAYMSILWYICLSYLCILIIFNVWFNYTHLKIWFFSYLCMQITPISPHLYLHDIAILLLHCNHILKQIAELTF